MTVLKTLQRRSWQVSEDHGFHEAMLNLDPKILATYLKLLLTIGELSEAAEELRDGHDFTEIYYEYNITGGPDGYFKSDRPWASVRTDPESGQPFVKMWRARPTQLWLNNNGAQALPGKPCGFPVELADTLIRLCDLAEDVGVDLSRAAELKESYNRTRKHMHGKTA